MQLLRAPTEWRGEGACDGEISGARGVREGRGCERVMHRIEAVLGAERTTVVPRYLKIA
jgi:hypothetical protein